LPVLAETEMIQKKVVQRKEPHKSFAQGRENGIGRVVTLTNRLRDSLLNGWRQTAKRIVKCPRNSDCL